MKALSLTLLLAVTFLGQACKKQAEEPKPATPIYDVEITLKQQSVVGSGTTGWVELRGTLMREIYSGRTNIEYTWDKMFFSAGTTTETVKHRFFGNRQLLYFCLYIPGVNLNNFVKPGPTDWMEAELRSNGVFLGRLRIDASTFASPANFWLAPPYTISDRLVQEISIPSL
ncbi:hypothetical protein [Hymenobacter cellulosivorans]|uniref:Uncharacterized protein n=1 Tax=Hymenobacter cellulosivorans TaxID=2932249 RepID=A0ABY4F375_9BACT|nr:hypothetical protein [Hymenobacter cellulosivorans]UOQ50705.1 hypothetical protein MUN80_13140 [Hymenobacter cellulosivorans]